jgi:outer membrane protein assembly factor BamB
MPLFSAATSNIATTGTRAIVCTHDYSVRGLDTRNGAYVWLHRPAPGELGPSYSSPVFKGNVAYVGSIDGRVLGFDADTGRKVFDVNVRPAKTDALFDSIPAIDGDKLYIGSVGGNLYCVDIPSAKVDWSVALQPGFIFTRPALWNGRVLVASMGYKVYEVAPPGAPKPAAE